jgi:ferric-dicitrate binding protein FerR (iron transport regulator)
MNTREHSARELVKQGTDQIVLRRSSGTVALGHGSQSLGDSSVLIQADAKGVVYSASKAGQAATVIYDTLEVPRGKTYQLQLPDGSKVVLNAASRLIFPEAFQGNTRQVYIQGEAFFDIQHDPRSAFIVHAGGAEMKVLGTSFNVNTFNKELTTTLVSGKLMVSSSLEKVILSPGEQSTCNQDGSISKQKVDARLYTAWSHGDLYFDNERLENITENLGRTYDYDFEFRDRSLEDIRLTLDMPKPPSLDEVFKQIQLTGTKLKVNIQGRKVVVMRDK